MRIITYYRSCTSSESERIHRSHHGHSHQPPSSCFRSHRWLKSLACSSSSVCATHCPPSLQSVLEIMTPPTVVSGGLYRIYQANSRATSCSRYQAKRCSCTNFCRHGRHMACVRSSPSCAYMVSSIEHALISRLMMRVSVCPMCRLSVRRSGRISRIQCTGSALRSQMESDMLT
jgi:hypothetical protein